MRFAISQTVSVLIVLVSSAVHAGGLEPGRRARRNQQLRRE